MRRPAALFALLLACAVGAAPEASAAHKHKHAGRTPERKAADAPASGRPLAAAAAVLRQVQPQLDEIRGCYARERAKNPALGAAEVVLHAIIEANGQVVDVAPHHAKATSGDGSGVVAGVVAPCVIKRIRAMRLAAFGDDLARKIVIAFRFGADAPQAGAQAMLGNTPEQIRLGRSVVAGESVGFSRSLGQLTHRYCWKVDGDREGCALRVLNLFPAVRVKKEQAIYKPGEALLDTDRSSKESRFLRELSGDDSFRWPPGAELTAVAWPDDAAAVVLPDIGVALSAGGGRIDVAHAGPDGEEIATPRLDLRGGKAAHLVAVHWAPSIPVVAIAVRRPAAAGDPPQTTRATDVEIIQLGK